jgi:N-acetylglutamate synthase-like GNAT family acetyltransferase
MGGTVLKITALTPQLDLEIEELLAGEAIEARWGDEAELFATFDGEGRLAGLACATRRGGDCLLRFVVVRSDARGGGVGSALVNHVLGYFSGRGERLYTIAGDAVPFFERFGFGPVSRGELPAVLAGDAAAGGGGAARGDVMVIDLPASWTIP